MKPRPRGWRDRLSEPVNRSVLRRIGVKTSFLLVWGLIQWPSTNALALIYLFGISAAFSLVLVGCNRSSVVSTSLNYWDEAIVYLAISASLYYIVYKDADRGLAHQTAVHQDHNSKLKPISPGHPR
jgi:hypothetical protein